MDNRDRDKMSKKSGSTPAGDINRETSREGQVSNDSDASFGQKIGNSESYGSEPSRGSGSNDDTTDIETNRSSRRNSSGEMEH